MSRSFRNDSRYDECSFDVRHGNRQQKRTKRERITQKQRDRDLRILEKHNVRYDDEG